MAYFVTDQCVNCGVCEPECPVNAISESNNARVIDPSKCVDCGICASVCQCRQLNRQSDFRSKFSSKKCLTKKPKKAALR